MKKINITFFVLTILSISIFLGADKAWGQCPPISGWSFNCMSYCDYLRVTDRKEFGPHPTAGVGAYIYDSMGRYQFSRIYFDGTCDIKESDRSYCDLFSESYPENLKSLSGCPLPSPESAPGESGDDLAEIMLGLPDQIMGVLLAFLFFKVLLEMVK